MPSLTQLHHPQSANHMAFLREDSASWHDAWAHLELTYGELASSMSAHGECWQYMGSIVNGVTARHQFRHRQLPSTNQRTLHECVTPYIESDYR